MPFEQCHPMPNVPYVQSALCPMPPAAGVAPINLEFENRPYVERCFPFFEDQCVGALPTLILRLKSLIVVAWRDSSDRA